MGTNSIPGPAVGYTDLIDAVTNQRAEEEATSPSRFPLRPSASGYCARRLAWELLEWSTQELVCEKEVRTPETMRLLKLGHSIEFPVIRDFRQLGAHKVKYNQQTVSMFTLKADGAEDWLVEGNNDFALWHPDYRAVIDVKSTKDAFDKAYKSRWVGTLDKYDELESFQRIGPSMNAFYIEDLEAAVEELGDDWVVDNLLQLNLYCCSPFFQEREVDHGVIYKYNKNDSRHYEIRFKPSMAMFNKVKEKFNTIYKEVLEHGEDGVQKVAKEYTLGSNRCAFCPFKSKCWEEDALKEWFKSLPPKSWPTSVGKLNPEVREELDSLHKKYLTGVEESANLKKVEETICKIMEAEKIRKIEMSDGKIYRLAYLKSPRPHLALRRDKL